MQNNKPDNCFVFTKLREKEVETLRSWQCSASMQFARPIRKWALEQQAIVGESRLVEAA